MTDQSRARGASSASPEAAEGLSRDQIAAAARQAILADLSAIEAWHCRCMERARLQSDWERADQYQRLAEQVRGCIVTAQAAVTRAIESTRPPPAGWQTGENQR